MPKKSIQLSSGLQPSRFIQSSSAQLSPDWWEINIFLSTIGDYKLKEGETLYIGQYSFDMPWTGCMERDMDDFIIYHEKWEVQNWMAQETAESPSNSSILTHDKFEEKPKFVFNYIIPKNGHFYFNFFVDGLSIPQSKSRNKYNLHLPTSEEKTRNSQASDYNQYITEGSNRIIFDIEKDFSKSTEKTFHWNWKYQKWLENQNKRIYIAHTYLVEVKISIVPHFIRRCE
jgi:hypothetical protein